MFPPRISMGITDKRTLKEITEMEGEKTIPVAVTYHKLRRWTNHCQNKCRHAISWSITENLQAYFAAGFENILFRFLKVLEQLNNWRHDHLQNVFSRSSCPRSHKHGGMSPLMRIWGWRGRVDNQKQSGQMSYMLSAVTLREIGFFKMPQFNTNSTTAQHIIIGFSSFLFSSLTTNCIYRIWIPFSNHTKCLTNVPLSRQPMVLSLFQSRIKISQHW